MPGRQQRRGPLWRPDRDKKPPQVVQFKGRRQVREFARQMSAGEQQPARKKGQQAAQNDALARTGAWRFRRHVAPFGWVIAVIIAGLSVRATQHPQTFGVLGGLSIGAIITVLTRGHAAFVKRSGEVAAVITAGWVPALAALGWHAPIPSALALTWAPCVALWVNHYRWRPQAAPPTAEKSDYERWNALAEARRWNAHLGTAEQLPGAGRRYPIQADGITTTIGNILSASENVAGAWHKPMTETYAERDPQGITSRGYLTILGSETLMTGREWNGVGIDWKTGLAVIGRFADGSPAHLKFCTPRYGPRHGIMAGTTGSGKSEMISTTLFIALVSGRFVPIVLDPQEGQSLPFWRDRVMYAAGVDACHNMLRGLHAGMLDRSRNLADLRWEEDGIPMRGMPFFDYDLTGLPMPLIMFDEAHMALKGKNRAGREIVEMVTEIGRLGRKTGTALWLATHIPSLAELGGEQALRDMLRGGNVISLRTANRVAHGMLGLEKDPSEIPQYFTNGKETTGLGYIAGPDNRPDAPMRTDVVPNAMRRAVPEPPRLDDRFLEAMDRAMNQGTVLLPSDAGTVPARETPADDAPEGRRAVDAVWEVLRRAGGEMDRGEIIAAAGELVTGEWGREKPYSIRAVGDALRDLASGKVPGRPVVKVREGVYQTIAPKPSKEIPAMTTELEPCPGCGSGPGSDHGDECDHARCPECGEQLIGCHEHGDSNRPARWHGVDQRAEVARKLGWWTTAAGIDHLVEDYTRVLYADGLGQITWDPQDQRYVIGEIDNAVLDQKMSNS